MSLLPIHGFVLAGGKSSRMGRDKALIEFRGRPMVEIAVEKLRSFCAEVSIAGNRDDLNRFAAVVPESRAEAGPAGGIEAGVMASSKPWTLFIPVDVPLIPAELLREWVEAVLTREEADVRLSFLRTGKQVQPTFCLVHRDCRETIEFALDEKLLKLDRIFDLVKLRLDASPVWIADAESFLAQGDTVSIDFWFSNINTVHELEVAELWAATWAGRTADPPAGMTSQKDEGAGWV